MTMAALSGCDHTKTDEKQDHNGPSGIQCQHVQSGCGNKVENLPTPKDCAAGALPVNPQFYQQDTTVDKITSAEEGGRYSVRAEGYSRAGYMLPVNNQGCSYSVEVTVTLTQGLRTTDTWGWGYGLGACNSWTEQRPQGFSLQYAFYNSGGTISPNNTLNAYPDVNDLKASTGTINSNGATHVWLITVDGSKVTINQDGGPVGTFNALKDPKSRDEYARSLPTNCDNKGVFLRVFNAEVTFSDIKIEVLAS